MWNRWAPGRLRIETAGDLRSVAIYPELFEIADKPKLEPAQQLYSTKEALELLKQDPDLNLWHYHGPLDDVYCANPRITLGWAFYKRIMRMTHSLELGQLLRNGWEDALKSENWEEQISWYAVMSKKTGVEWGLYAIDFATCKGYQGNLSVEEEYKAAFDWVGKKKVRGYPESEEAFLRDIRLEAERITAGLMNDKSYIKFTPDQYANTPSLWGTSGAVVYDKKRRLVGSVNGVFTVAKDTKWAEAASISPDEVIGAMRRKKSQYAKVVQKRETKKTRLVISANLEQYWCQDYCSESLLDQIFSGSELSTLWMSRRQTGEFWEDFRVTQYGYNMPLDQSEFDQNQSAKSIHAVLQGVRDAVRARVNEDWLEVFDNALYSMKGGYVQTQKGRIPYKSGVLSGWRWTAWLDTLLSITSSRVALKRTNVVPMRQCFQGDDVRARFERISDAGKFRREMESYGYVVNPRKFFVSAARDEFLRRTAVYGRVQGYPARSVNTILWSSPLQSDVAPGIERLTEMQDKWEILKGRMQVDNNAAIDAMMIGEMARANQLSKSTVREWLGTDAAWGGGSLTPSSLTATVSASEPEEMPMIRKAPGIIAEVKQCNLLAFPLKFAEAARVWAKRVKWKKLTYTKASRREVKIRPSIPLRRAKAPEPPELEFWNRFFAINYTESWAGPPETWWPGASTKLRKDSYLGLPMFAAPTRMGLDAIWMRTQLRDYFDDADGTLYSLRTRTTIEQKRIQSSLNLVISHFIKLRFSTGVMR